MNFKIFLLLAIFCFALVVVSGKKTTTEDPLALDEYTDEYETEESETTKQTTHRRPVPQVAARAPLVKSGKPQFAPPAGPKKV